MRATDRLVDVARSDLLPGAAAGLIGGIFFGLAFIELGVLSSVASLVRTDSEIAGLLVHAAIAAIVGAGLGLLMHGRRSAGDTVLWGITYAAFFWFLGPLTLQPLILGGVPAWDVSAAQAEFPSLLGHILWGTTAALALVIIKSWLASRHPDEQDGTVGTNSGGTYADSGGTELDSGGESRVAPATASRGRIDRLPRGLILRGLLAGAAGFIVISLVPVGQERMLSALGQTDMAGAAWMGPLVIALIWGLLYALGHPRSTPTAGAAVVRGAGFGFLFWVIAGLTVLPILRGDGLDWSIPDAQAAFPAFVGSILFGAIAALVYHWLVRLTPILFSDEDPDAAPDGGSWGLRAVVRGAGAGLVGGLIFTVVMVQIGFLPTVASLVGSGSELVGLMVHVLIGMTIGATYGVLFRRQTFDPGAAVGWGVSYGFVWWLLGPLTLAPIILGASPAWSIEAAAAAFPGLIGHLAYGAALGLTFYLLEARYTPWWISRTEREVRRMEDRRLAAGTAGPALWALLVLIAVLLPTVLATPMDEQPAGPYAIESTQLAPGDSSTPAVAARSLR